MLMVINIAALILFVCLVFPAATAIISGFTKKKKQSPEDKTNYDYAVVITAYKNYMITVPSIDSFASQNYPGDKFHIYVVADACEDAARYDSKNVTVLVPKAPLNSKVKSIEYAIDNFIRKPDYLIVMDADNLVLPGFLSEINNFAGPDKNAVQGRRTHKNLDTVYSCLDAAGEIYYNHTQRTVPFNLGSSAAIAGSGMAVKLSVMLSFLLSIKKGNEIIVAEDKLLQNYLVKNNSVISFAESALIFDEKISDGYQTQRQRTRWLNSYFINLKSALGIIYAGISNFSFNQIFFGIMTSYPPIITMITGSAFLFLMSILFGSPAWIIILAGWFIFGLNFLILLAVNKAKKEIWKSLLYIPLFAFRQITALFNMKKSNKDFMATEHKVTLSLKDVVRKNSK